MIWLLILVTTSIGAIVVYVDLNELYQTVRIQTTIKNTMLPIFRIPFPSIGLCPRNRLNWKMLETEAVDHFLGANVSAAQKDLFVKFFTAAGDPHLSRLNEMSNFFGNKTLTDELHMLDHLDLREVYKFIQFRCQDLFHTCRWRGNPVNCCDVIEYQFTEAGLCFVFNTEISPASRQKAVSKRIHPHTMRIIKDKIIINHSRGTTNITRFAHRIMARAPAWISFCGSTDPSFDLESGASM